jgi:thiosulfate dehydrogenase [quinone] large subunit
MKEKDPEKTDTKPQKKDTCCCGSTLGFLTLRLWLGVRSLMTGIEKYAGTKASDAVIDVDGAPSTHGLTSTESVKVYGLEHYHGVPESMKAQFEAEPMIPGFALNLYTAALGPVLIILGVTLLLGIFTRVSLFLMGLLYISLTVGLILLKQDAGIAWLGIHIIMIAYALNHANDNRCALMKKW